MLESLLFDTGPNPTWAMIWLHGLGADGHDLLPLMAECLTGHGLAARCLFPHAPQREVTLQGHARMRAWYDISSSQLLDAVDAVDAAGINASVAQLNALITSLSQQGFPYERLFLAGFSQGGVIALHTGLRFRYPLAGIIALSSYLPDVADTTPDRDSPSLPIFLAHGIHDPIVPLPLAQAAADRLRQRRYLVQWHSYNMGHQICPEEIADLRRWIANRLQPPMMHE